MRRIYRVLERGRLICGEGREPDSLFARRLPPDIYARLRDAEQSRESRGEAPVFQWGTRAGVEFAIVGPWVGVIEVGAVQIEILPKADQNERPNIDGRSEDDVVRLIQGNLLEMLDYAGKVPVRVRGHAAVSVRRGSLQDALVQMFLERLVTEFRRGQPRAYASHEEELGTIRGRLMVQRQIIRNAAKPHRLWCRFDELELDPVLGGVFACACRILQRRALNSESRRLLAEATSLLEEAEPVVDTAKLSVHFTRQTDRFRDIYEFARMIVAENAPEQRAGATRSFNLLYQMDALFEGFVAEFIEQEVFTLGDATLAGCVLRPQAKTVRKYLLTREGSDGKGVLHMRPDLVFERNGVHFIADTKWKHLEPGTAPTPSNADLYQMYTYLHEYGGRRVTLIYPCTDAGRPRADLRLTRTTGESGRWVAIRFVNLGEDLASAAGRTALAKQLRDIIVEGIGDAEVAETHRKSLTEARA
jgi:5-methylcytosine-specific restriction enzyme subunit McrC